LIDTGTFDPRSSGDAGPAAFQGTSVLDPGSRMSLLFTDYSLGWLGVYDACRKYLFEIDSARSHMYDLCSDLHETADISSPEAAQAAAYHAIVERWMASQ
jgi:hypothetical protein